MTSRPFVSKHQSAVRFIGFYHRSLPWHLVHAAQPFARLVSGTLDSTSTGFLKSTGPKSGAGLARMFCHAEKEKWMDSEMNTCSPGRCQIRGKRDGGLSWFVVFSSFIQQFVVIGTHNVFGLFYIDLLNEFNKSKAATAWVASLSFGLTFLLGPLSTASCGKFGVRQVSLIGSALFSIGLLLTSFVTNLSQMYLTYSILVGIGGSLCYYTSILILDEYFRKTLVTANGFALSGAGVGTLALSPVVEILLERYRWRGAMQILSVIASAQFLCSFIQYIIKPPQRVKAEKYDLANKKGSEREIKFVNVTLFKNKAYVLWILVVSLVLFGFYIPYVHLVSHCQDLNIPKSKGAILVGYLAISQTIGKIVFGRIADHPRVNRIYLYQFCLLACSVSTTLLPIMTSIETITIYCWVFGFHDGCFVLLIAVITGDVVGKENMASAFGMMYFFSCIPMMIGPPVAGLMYGITGTYEPAFFMAGGLTFIGVCLLFFVPILLPQEILQRWSMRSNREEVYLSSVGISSVPSESSKTWSLSSDEILKPDDPKSFPTYVSVKPFDAAPKIALFKEEDQKNRLSLILEQYFFMQQLVNQRDSLISRMYSSDNLYESFYTTHVRETDV